jgi:hypothetical protein
MMNGFVILHLTAATEAGEVSFSLMIIYTDFFKNPILHFAPENVANFLFIYLLLIVDTFTCTGTFIHIIVRL